MNEVVDRERLLVKSDTFLTAYLINNNVSIYLLDVKKVDFNLHFSFK